MDTGNVMGDRVHPGTDGEEKMKPGDINAEGKEIEQDGDITWPESLTKHNDAEDKYQQITWDNYET